MINNQNSIDLSTNWLLNSGWGKSAEKLITRLSGSHLLKTAVLGTMTAIAGALALRDLAKMQFSAALPLTGLLALATCKYINVNWKPLRNEARLHQNLLNNHRGTFPWWNEIIPNKLVVGGIPLANFGHDTQLKELGVTHVLSVVEPEEFDPKLFTVPLVHNKDDDTWLQISTPDLHPVPEHLLAEGVAWLEKQISQGHMVYVHCKSGKGRSIAIAIAFLAAHGQKYSQPIRQIVESDKDMKNEDKINAIFKYVKVLRPLASMSRDFAHQINDYINHKK